MAGKKATSFWVANGSKSKILVKADTNQLQLSKLQVEMGCSVSGQAAIEFAGQGASAGGSVRRERREEYQRKFIDHGFVPVGCGKYLPFQGEYVMICDQFGDTICGNYKVKPNCSVIVLRNKTIQVSAPIKAGFMSGKIDDRKMWRSFDGDYHYIDPSEEEDEEYESSVEEQDDDDDDDDECDAVASPRHDCVTCDECGQRGIIGARWKCAECFDYDLCSTCYVTNRHDMTHRFTRFDTPHSKGIPVEPRKKPSVVQQKRGNSKEEPCCRALYDFEGDDAEELSFNEGDVMKLLKRLDENWLMAELDGYKGLIPENYVEILTDLPDKEEDDENDYETIRELFEIFDHDNRGYLKPTEVRRIINLSGTDLSAAQLDELISEADADGDGRINCEEFINLMMQVED